MSPANEKDLGRWMGRVEQTIANIDRTVSDEKEGSAGYRRDMRERMERQDHSLADLDRDMKEIKPVVWSLRDAGLKQKGAILVLATLGTIAGAVFSTLGGALWQAMIGR